MVAVVVDAGATAAATDKAELRDEINDGLRRTGARLLYPFDELSTPEKWMEIEAKKHGKRHLESANTRVIWHR